MDFYEPRYQEVGTPQSIDERIKWLRTLSPLFLELILHDISLVVSQELAENIRLELADDNFEEAVRLIDDGHDIIREIPNVTTDSIEEGRIASLTVNSFMTYRVPGVWGQEHLQILSFLQDIYGYEHLIIVLTKNGGGAPAHFYETVISQLITETLTIEGYAFFNYFGSYVHEYIRRPSRQWSTFSMHRSLDNLRPINEILEEYDLPHFNLEDAHRLTHGYPLRVIIEPDTLESAFDGKIWLLTGRFMGSAAQIVPWVVKETDFATLVGEVTWGVFGGPRTFVTLPNSGIAFQTDLFYVTDQYGFPLEAGTTPHHFNREGMDALETALALIEEGAYR